MRARVAIAAGVAITAALLQGCIWARKEPVYGNLVASGPAPLVRQLSSDSVGVLMALYPPTMNRFYLAQDLSDGYGKSLVDGLKAQGYGVTIMKESEGPGLKLGYRLDAPAGANVYRISLYVGPETVSRAYVPTAAGGIAAAGPWSRSF